MKYKLGLLLLTLIVNVNLSAGHGIIKGLLGSLGAGGGFSGSFSSSSASSHASAYSNSISGQFTNGGGVDANQNIIDDNLKFGIYPSGGVSSNANAAAFAGASAGSGGGSECCKGSTGTTYDNKPVVSNGGGSISLPASGSSSFANSFSTAGAGSYSTGLTSGLVNSLPGPKGNIHDSKPVPLGGSSVIYKPSAGGNYGGTTTGGGSAITASHPPVGAGISGGIVGTLPGAPGNIHDSKPAPFGGSGAGGIYSGASAGTFTQGPGLTATHPSVGSGISGGVIGSLPGSPGSIHESKPSTSGSFASSVSGASAGSSSGITVINNKPNYGTGPGITATHPPVGAGISGGVIGTLPGSSGSIHDSKPICTGVQPGGKPGCGVAPGLNIQIQGDIGGSTGGLIEAHRGPPPKHFATSPPVGPGGGLQEGVRGPPPVSHELQPPYKASTTYKPIGQSIHQTSYGTSSGSESGSSISIHFDKTDRNDYLGGPVSGGSNGQIGAKGDGITFVQNEHVKPAFVPKPLAVSSGSDIPNIGTLPLEQPHLVSYGPENSQGGAGFGIGGEFQVNKPKDNGYATGEVIVQKPDGSVKPVLGDSVKQGGGGVGFGFSIGGAKSDLFTSKPVVEAPKHVYKPVATVVVEESPKQVFKPATTTVVEESSQQGGGGFGGGFATGQVVVNKPNVYAVVEESPNQGNLYGSGGSGYGGAGYGGGFGIASSGGTGGGYATGDVQVQKSDGTIVGVVEESSKGGGCNGGCGGGSGSYGYSSSNSFGGSGGGYGQGGGFGGGFGGSFEGANLGGSLNKLFSAGTAHLKSGLNKIANIVGNGGASGGFSTAGSFSKASSHASSASFAAAGSSSGSYFK